VKVLREQTGCEGCLARRPLEISGGTHPRVEDHRWNRVSKVPGQGQEERGNCEESLGREAGWNRGRCFDRMQGHQQVFMLLKRSSTASGEGLVQDP
jgi:hypothetical protein